MGTVTKGQTDNERIRIGDNGGPTFDDIVRDNLDRGLLLTMKEVIVEAVRDPRLDRRHLRVLAEVMACINSQTGLAYPSRTTVSASTRRWDLPDGTQTFGYTEAGIAKTLSELVEFGYLVSIKRAPERGKRALSLYTIRKPSIEDLQNQITEWIMAQRMAPPRAHPVAAARRAAVVTSPCDVTSDVTTGGDVTSPGNVSASVVTHVGNDRPPDVTSRRVVTSPPVVTSDVTSPDRTVTNRGTIERTDMGVGEREEDLGPGEDHVGHGVFVNGQTIRHNSFAISLPGIQMGTLNSGLTANEVKDHCVAHALQWAAEIEIGKSPRDVLPSKIANFLSRSIIGAVNQQKIQAVRTKREEQPFAGRGRGTVPDGAQQETELERTKRILAGG